MVFLTALLMAEPREFQEPVPQIRVRKLEPTGWEAPPGWYGFVPAAGSGIVRRAGGMSPDDGLNALERLGEPEQESRSQEFDGRRLIRVNGGYLVLNYEKYRERDYTAAERMRRWRERQRGTRNGDAETRNVAQAESREQRAEVEEPTSKTSRRKPKPASDLPPRFADDSTEMKAARYLFGKMRENNPDAKEPNWQAWAREVDRILRIDLRDKDELRRVIDWCQSDSFWQGNVLSPGNLRKHYDRLAMNMRAPKKPEKPERPGPKPHPLAPHLPPFTL